MTSLILTQPNYLPWRGLIDHLIIADRICIYDSIPLPRASGGKSRGFSTRVQILNKGVKSWLTIPVPSLYLSNATKIDDISITTEHWTKKHLKTLHNAYCKTEGFRLIEESIMKPLLSTLGDEINLNKFLTKSMRLILKSFGYQDKKFSSSSAEISICDDIDKTTKLIRHCKHFECDTYISGLGALNYIDHELFTKNSIEVFYMDYDFDSYKQPGLSSFDPYVTSLDFLCNNGIPELYKPKSRLINWRDAIANAQ